MNPESEDILSYAKAHTNVESALLKKLTRETQAKVLFPRMLSGHLQGSLLKMLCRMIQPKQVLEIGTYTGYATICFAESTADDACIHTIEINPELEDFAKQFFMEAGVEHKIKYYSGDALNVILKLDETFDLVFIDADKEHYTDYYHLIFSKVRPGGYILADNVLWDGKVLSGPNEHDKETKGIVAFNEAIQNDSRVENLLLPFRDGLMIIRKK
jgi:caffeoyl-CoA O-methyltransferase